MPKHNQFAAFHNESSDEETEHHVNSNRDELFRCGRAFWLEQQRGNRMKWGDWCDEDSGEELEKHQKQPDGFIVQKKNNKKRNKKGKRC